ncbi:MAG: methionine--tRNA ligase [Parachlamydiales bacterium]|jgi:methionyl-tRNA synthetase
MSKTLKHKEKILITSALLYANGPMHFGHIAGAYLPADCYARFKRLQGNDVLYISGSDEYGMAITLSAELAGKTPREHVDNFHHINQSLFAKMNVSFDHYARTTWEGHIPVTHAYFNDLYQAGHIVEKVTDQLYSEKDDKFLADRYVIGTCPKCGYEKARGDECGQCGTSYDAIDLINPCSKLTGSPLTRRPTKHWFLQLEDFKGELLTWLEGKNWKPNVVNFIKGYIDGLHARAITRDMTWGVPIPLPGTEGKVLYVWFDAPIGYISATIEWAQLNGTPEKWKDYWQDPKTKLVQFIGKDNIPFHAAIFPAMTMGQKQPYKLVDELPANEFYKLEGRQFSKSDGWYIDLEEFLKTYTSDQIRYTIASNMPETSDSEFTWKDFQLKVNSELVGKFGNLVNRVLVFAQQHCDGAVPKAGELSDKDRQFLADLETLHNELNEAFENFKVRRACQLVMEIAQKGNVYFNDKKPWQDAKEQQFEKVNTTIRLCIECLRILAIASYPIIPESAQKIWRMLGLNLPVNLDEKLEEDMKLGKPEILFQKIEDSAIEAEVAKLHASLHKEEAASAKAKCAHVNVITIDQVRSVDLCVAKVVAAEKITKSTKLLKLQLDDGSKMRTIVAGIATYYTPEEILNKHIVLVANLQPAKLLGVESHGMLLAAKWDDKLELLTVPNAPPGSRIG